jgi:glycosyltransferase involved in cell wall biosynthesis
VHDVRRLRRLVREGDYALVHCHGSWDHFVAGRGLGRRGRARTPIVRTDHAARELRRSWLWRSYFGPVTIDHLVVLSDRLRAQAVDRLRLDPEGVTTIRGAVDADDFRPIEPPADIREQLGLDADDVVIGVVARVQKHRRFEVLLEAATVAREHQPRLKVAVCGRGTHKRTILDRPLRRMGLEDVVLPLGYRTDDYRQVLAMFDAGLMLVPGSDGSCRAAMEMAAMEKPLIVARRGVLPEIVRDGETGIVVHDTPERLALAMLEMTADASARRRWGRAARRRMQRMFGPDRQVEEHLALYRRLLDQA